VSRPPLVRQLTPEQQKVAEQALAIMPEAIAAFWRGHPCLRKYRGSIDSTGAAMTAITLASFCFDERKSKMSTYFTVAIRNELRKEAMKEQRRREDSSPRHALSATDKRASLPDFGEAQECMSRLEPPARDLIHQAIVIGRRVTEIAREQGRDPRTLQRRLEAALRELRGCVEATWVSPSDTPDPEQ